MKKAPLYLCVMLLLVTVIAGPAWANDQVVSTVTPLTNPYTNPPIIQINGVQQGNIRLLYTVIGNSFPCGAQDPFATFNLNMVDQAGTSTRGGIYPATLTLAGSGHGTPVQLSPSPDTYTVTGRGWNDNSTVTVNIPDCAGLPTSDGSVIDGQMNQSTNNGAHLDTITSVQVHIMLVYPTPNACLKLYSLESDQDTFDLLTSVTIVAPHTTVKATNPGSISADALVVNTCVVPQTYDVMVNLDPSWQTTPPNAIGNATFTYTSGGEFDPNNYNLATWGAGSPQGQKLCINNFTLPAGDSFLMRVHSQIMGVPVAQLPGYPAGGNFGFMAALFAPNTNCLGSLLPTSLVSPANPGTSALGWTF